MGNHNIRAGLIGLMLAAAAGAGAFAQGTAPTDPPAQGAKPKTHPKFISGPEAEFPEAARAAGEFGKVIVSGIIGVDGRLHEAKVTVSSRSTLLDASALAAASAAVFEPARDEQGVVIAMPVKVPYTFSNASPPGKSGGVLRYRCDQFARDYDWWYKVWPADQHDDFYLVVLGYSSIAKAVRPNGSLDYSTLGNTNKDFESRWKVAVEECRKSPDRLFIDIFRPEGDLLRRMAHG